MSIELDKNGKNIGRLDIIKDFVKRRWRDYYEAQEGDKVGESGIISYIFGIPYTPHDEWHSLKIEEILSTLLSNKDVVDSAFSDDEKFLLLAAVWLHDIGMIPDLLPDNIKDARELRKRHAKRAADYISNHCNDFGLLRQECEDLAIICDLHRRAEKIPDDLNDKVRLIIAYLRLADALQIPERASVDEIKEHIEFGMDPVQKYHWLKSFFVRSVEPSVEKTKEFKIIVEFKNPREWDGDAKKDISPLVEILTTELKDELDAVKDILMEGQIKYNLPAYIDIDYKFGSVSLTDDDKAELFDLLAIIELFNPVMSPNSGKVIDIVLRQIEKFADIGDTETCLEKLCDYWLHTLKPLLNDRPCHAYVKKVHERYENQLKIDNIKRLSADEKRNLRSDIQEVIKELFDRRSDLKRLLPQKILSENQILFDENDSVLVYGYSGSVVMVLDALKKKIKNKMKVYVCACTSKIKHRYNNRLIYADGIKYLSEIERIGIKNRYYIPDLGASHLFSPRFSIDIEFENALNKDTISDRLKNKFENKGFSLEKPTIKQEKDKWVIIDEINDGRTIYTVRKEDERLNVYSPDKITKVLFGANGIDENTGEVAHGLGHLGIADMANIYGIPVYVITESMKIGTLGKNPGSMREGPWYPTDVQVENIDETIAYNPREERVPRKKITAIVTEKGSAYFQESLRNISTNIGIYPEGID